MCGIVGYITVGNKDYSNIKSKFLEEGLYVNALRGTHSTGLVQVHDDFRWSWVKRAVSASSFIKYKEFRERDTNSWCSIGHNRHATMGSINTDNAHPFHEGEIILVHNGTLLNTHSFEFPNKDIEVDSQLIAYNLSKVAPDKAHEVVSKANGAYALVWLDTRDESVNMVRNRERPLHLGISDDKKIMYFMSDGHMLNMIINRVDSWTTKPDDIYSLETNKILKFKKGSLVPEVTSVAPFVHSIPYYPPTGRKTSGHGGTKNGGSKRKITVDGAKVNIPKQHLKMLREWYGLEVGTDLQFVRGKYMYWGNHVGCVYGRVYHEEWDTWFNARVPFVSSIQNQNYKGEKWTVMPVGVDHTSLDGTGGEVTFICKIIWFSWWDKKDRTSHACEESDETCLIGPNETKIEANEWDILTESGCAMCSSPIYRVDAEDILWVGEHNNQPLCVECSDYTTQADAFL